MARNIVNVLMVDDDEDEYIVVEKYLKRATTNTYTVKWVDSFERALEVLEGSRFHVCLLDYQLGAHTGIELLREIRKRGHNVPVILLTGHGNVAIDVEAMEQGAFDYVEKTELTPNLLERSIRYAMENFRVREALRESNEELERRVEDRTAELRRSNVELEQFAAGVARDLQEPLAVLGRYMATFEKRATQQPAPDTALNLSSSFETVFLAIRNMELLVRIVLDYSRTSGQRAPFEAVDTASIVAQVRDDLDSQLKKAGARLEIGELPTVKGDPRLLRGLFENLIDNSLKYHSDAPIEVSVSASRRGDSWVFTIEDNGIGVSEEDSDEVFLMFARGSRTQDIPGVGIGLALCRKIVEYHAGRIWIDSGDEGGTRIAFTLPAE